MHVTTGRMKDPGKHHRGRVRVFRFGWTVEIWVGERYLIIGK